jgi:hypothetical protein
MSYFVKALLLMAAGFIVIGCGETEPLPPTGLKGFTYRNDTVQLLRMVSVTDKKSGIESNYRCVMVRLKDLNQNKEIFIHSELEDGSWEALNDSSEFIKQAESGYEVWRACAYRNTVRGGLKWGKRFVIKYVAGTQTFWDNNGGTNYVIGPHDGTLIPSGAQHNVLLNQANVYKSFHGSNIFSGTIDVRNMSLNKKVKVVYTNDKWATTRFINANFTPSISLPYAESIKSPNVHGIERWYFEVEMGGNAAVEFAIEYSGSNAGPQWDNNFGRNYFVTIDNPLNLSEHESIIPIIRGQ